MVEMVMEVAEAMELPAMQVVEEMEAGAIMQEVSFFYQSYNKRCNPTSSSPRFCTKSLLIH